MQATVRTSVTFTGAGLHSGTPATIVVRPAVAGHGIWFCRTDVASGDNMIPAIWHSAEHAALCTKLVNDDGLYVSTVEHLMAALAGCGIRNALIDIDGPEVPILDGSSSPFVKGLLQGGLLKQEAATQAIEILKTVEVTQGDASARLEPASVFSMQFDIEFADAAIGAQSKSLTLSNGAFVHELANSRTFCRKADVDRMHAAGLALGGTYDNAIVVDGDTVLSPGGLRHTDEPVRHKMLDAVGDLALAGAPIIGRYVGHKSGHTLTNKLLHALFADPSAYRFVDCDSRQSAFLPGAGVTLDDIASV
ncbi:UDP-3-O-acyl-N-acetylglucosamine deacetylase [Shimia ponticola]|uniref:UDP-3-O-acyl-N-acetylglucosamine deacetylase n=1 Tax=Shimia ponticola TaxID=2582893 RepID=UPI0011BEB717|nr:UDP-3-O-acyl-N-acetylglucosamine deacetylase [Shimia ponticola]